ncbi:lipocalin family protein [Chitinibacter tainanensis]|uniref:lipocalin family protein n=1 Tax=Chitinibacter tainanensis TaxID=230667 RepID=UPI0003FB73AB|nr:lipocalin family protein [Chitinibacter tainanensis]
MPLRFALFACLLAPSLWAAEPAPVRSVPQLALERYAGQWYEIAKLPMFFQRQCMSNTTANYSLNPDGSIKVVNRCRKEDGSEIDATGRATVVPGSQNAQLEVSFFWPFKADYWVIGLANDYRWAVVGQPSRKYLWILARTPQLSEADLQAAQQIAVSQGYDLRELSYTPQTKGIATEGTK